MMQLGNLAIVAANHNNCMLQIYDNEVTVHIGCGTDRKSISCNVKDNDYINKIIAYLNFETKITEEDGNYESKERVYRNF